MSTHDVDPATVEVIRNYLTPAATEMQRILTRTAYNTIIYKILDFGISVSDRDLNLTVDFPGLAFSLGVSDYGIKKAIGHADEENMNPEDVLIMNHPHWSGTHTQDVLLFAFVFLDEEPIGYTTCCAHWLDLGTKDSGYVLDSADAHQEGILFLEMKVYEEGRPDPEIMDLIWLNSRMPDKVTDDLSAQAAAIRTGEQRLQELYEKYGGATVEAAIDKILEHGEETSWSAVVDLPDGTWSATGYADGVNRDPDDLIKLCAEVMINGEELSVDFSGLSPEAGGSLNIPPGTSETIGKLCFETLITPDEDSNGGQYVPLSVNAPEDIIFNTNYPAPTFTVWTGIVTIDVVYQVLTKGMPDRVPASTGGDLADIMLYGENPEIDRPSVEANNEGVGWGGGVGHDDANTLIHVSEIMVRNVPVEVFENKAPIRFDELFLRVDSGGPGGHRGGLGIRRGYHMLEPVGVLSIIQKARIESWGLDGGEPGAKNAIMLDSGEDDFDERIQVLVDNDDLYNDKNVKYAGMFRGNFRPGEVISNRTAGGDGYGDPFERDPDTVREDVLDGYVMSEAAREQYGVVVSKDGVVDEVATTRPKES